MRKGEEGSVIILSNKSGILKNRRAGGRRITFQEIKGYDNDSMIKLISRELSIPLNSIKDISLKIILRCLPLYRI